MDSNLYSKAQFTQLLLSKEITTWNQALLFVKQIPYGRNTNREDFSLVIKENKGTCSSKHALLKEIANENNIPNVNLIIGLYKMNEINTKIGSILSNNNLKYIPEAHCYLNINGKTVDVTSKETNFEKIKNAIISEIEIQPYQVSDFKVSYHKEFLKKWIHDNSLKIDFKELWSIREECIQKISD